MLIQMSLNLFPIMMVYNKNIGSCGKIFLIIYVFLSIFIWGQKCIYGVRF